MRDSRIPPNCATLINTVTVCCCFVYSSFFVMQKPKLQWAIQHKTLTKQAIFAFGTVVRNLLPTGGGRYTRYSPASSSHSEYGGIQPDRAHHKEIGGLQALARCRRRVGRHTLGWQRTATHSSTKTRHRYSRTTTAYNSQRNYGITQTPLQLIRSTRRKTSRKEPAAGCR